MIKRFRSVIALLTIPALEQITTSLGTLILMLLGARMLGGEEFGILALLWNLIQFPTAIFYAMVLLPISASQTKAKDIKTVLEHGLYIYLLTIIAAAILLPVIFNAIAGGKILFTPKIWLLTVCWLALQLAFEFVRWNVIRFGMIKAAFIANLVRWLLFLMCIGLTTSGDQISYGMFLGINFITLTCWFGVCLVSNPDIFALPGIRPRLSLGELRAAMPLLNSGIASASLNYVLVGVLTRMFSLEALGALQAYRSVANFFGTLSQFVDNHLTAQFARKNMNITLGIWFAVFSVGMVCVALLLGYFLKDFVSSHALNGEYAAYSTMFLVLLVGATLQLVIRPIAADIRLRGNLTPFYTSSAIVMLVVIPLVILSAYFQLLYVSISTAMLGPITILIPYLLGKMRNGTSVS